MKDLGENIILAAHNKKRADLNRAQGMDEVLSKSASYKQGVCAIAAEIYRDLGDTGQNALIYDKLSKSARWNNYFDPMVTAVEKALSGGLVKEASPVSSLATLGAAVREMPGGILGASGLAALLGAGGGALAHVMTSDTQAQDRETEAMMQKLENYRRYKEDIEKDLKRSGVTETEDQKDDQEFIEKYDI